MKDHARMVDPVVSGGPAGAIGRGRYGELDVDETRDEVGADAGPMVCPFHVVGIGASAGGLEALEQFFAAVPDETRLAFVVVQHLSPDFRSLMDELLARRTSLPIRTIEDRMTVEPGVIHLMPPRKQVTLDGLGFRLVDRDPAKGLNFPIDAFLVSLADSLGPRGVAVILSGTGTDGTRGARAVHSAGGLVLVQSADSAKFDGMPRSVIETGIAHGVLPAQGMVGSILRHTGGLEPDEEPEGPEGLAADCPLLARVFGRIQQQFGLDFSQYKPNTIARRLERRKDLSRAPGLEEYVDRLATDPLELAQLYSDLLIGVTRFFRDPDAFDVLARQALPRLIERLGQGEELRVWVAGCATGEEAYSMAILIHEEFEARGLVPEFRIFATDIHPDAIDSAGSGLYDASRLEGVSPERIARFFVPRGNRYQIAASLRARIVFSRQNMIKDAPFTRLDLISCRNLLIYLQAQTQRKAISMFHFGLNVGGVLFLGPSESLGEYADEFETIESHWKVYRKRRAIRLRFEVPSTAGEGRGAARGIAPARATPRSEGMPSALLGVYDMILGAFMPPSILINERREIVHSFSGAGRFLRPQEGRFSSDLLEMIHEGLRMAVATALHRAKKTAELVTYGGIPFHEGDRRHYLTLSVRPFVEARSKLHYLLITIQEDAPRLAPPPLEVPAGLPDAQALSEITQQCVRELEFELLQTKESLHVTIEELQTANEELQATNEEMIASNEELQSTNEELHSVNEELYTVNSEHQKKIEELTELTHDLDNLFVSTDLGIVFLDRELRIRKFTPRIEDQFALIPLDIGRRIDGFAHNLVDVDLVPLIEGVLRSGVPYEGEVRDRKSNWFLLRVMPYRSERVISGIVLALIDISGLKRIQGDLAVSERRHKALSRMFSSALWTANAQGEFQRDHSASPEGGPPDDAGATWFDSLLAEDRDRIAALWQRSLATREPLDTWARLWSNDALDYRDAEIRATPVMNPDGHVVEWVGQILDVHDRKRIAQEFQAIVDNVQAAIILKAADGRIIRANPCFADLVGLTHEDVVGLREEEVMPGTVVRRMKDHLQQVEQTRRVSSLEVEWSVRGARRAFLVAQCPIIDLGGRPSTFVTIFSEITALKQIQEERAVSAQLVEQVERQEKAEAEANAAVRRRDLFLSMLSHELRNPLNAIVHAADLLDRPGPLREDRVEQLHQIIRCQARHLGLLLNDLLDISRLNHGRINLRIERVDVAATTDEAVAVVRPEAEAKGIALVVDVVERPVWFLGDPTRLQQIQVNLLGNAIRYTPEGGEVEISVRQEASSITLAVRDNGRGMSEETLSRAFSLFYRGADVADDQGTSMGIGLTLVRRLVELHGGIIRASSLGPGLGSEFHVTLPLQPVEVPGAAVGEALPLIRTASPRHNGGRIVLVEDNHDTRMMLSLGLELDGYRVDSAPDGSAGLELIRAVRPDVAIVDIELPLLDGCEVARQVVHSPGCESVILVALTGYGQSSDTDALMGVGFRHHLVKPIRPAEVSAFLDKLLGAPDASD